MAWINEFLKENLPTPSTRWTALGTLSIVSVCIWLPEWLPKTVQLPTQLESLSIRLFLAVSFLSVGSLIINVLLTIKIKQLNTEKKEVRKSAEQIEPPKVDVSVKLEKMMEDFLSILSKVNTRPIDKDFADHFNIAPALATYYLVELRNSGFVTSTFGLDDDHRKVECWSLEQLGRKYLVFHKLLSPP